MNPLQKFAEGCVWLRAEPEIWREQERPENGRMRFGDDWTGLFIRGDRASYLSYILGELIAEVRSLPKSSVAPIFLAQLESHQRDLADISVRSPSFTQTLRSFEQCKVVK